MNGKRAILFLVLGAVTSCRNIIPLDTQGADAIPTEMAVAKLKELLPQAAYLSCTDPKASFMQSEIKGWTIDEKGIEFQTRNPEPFRLAYSEIQGADLGKVLVSYEVRVYTATAQNPRKDLFHFNWRQEEPARRAVELFEALRQKP